MSRDKLLPEPQLDSVVKALYASADLLHWSQLGPQDRSNEYDKWVEAAQIGGVLTRYMTPEAARSWIKDGPMKEYTRALRGEGRYARFGRQGGTSTEEITRFALGPQFKVAHGTRNVKPSRCVVDDGAGQHILVWGDARNFKNLHWAALRESIERALPATVVVLEPPGNPTNADTSSLFRKLCQRSGLSLVLMAERVAK